MTREDALNFLKSKTKNIETPAMNNLLDALEALGLIKFDKPSIIRLYHDDTMFQTFGVIKLELWPEGLVLWVGGEIVWKNWYGKSS